MVFVLDGWHRGTAVVVYSADCGAITNADNTNITANTLSPMAGANQLAKRRFNLNSNGNEASRPTAPNSAVPPDPATSAVPPSRAM